MLAVLVLGCTAGADTPQRRRDPGALVVAQASGAQKLDPVRVTDTESVEVGGLLFEGLVKWKPGTTDTVPGLAQEWLVSPDGKRWTFKLRPGVVFHDGTPLDAAAVVFSFERLLDPSHAYYVGAEGSYWRALLKSIARVTAIDAGTVEITTAVPYAPLLGDLAMYPIVSPTAVARWRGEFWSHPIGTGPFQLETWRPGEHVVVRRFERYWGEPARLERVVFRVIVDARQRLVELESGSVDLATSIRPDEQPFVELHPELTIHHIPGNDVSYLAFNLGKPGFRDLRVRRAANHAVNKEPIVKLAYHGRAIPASTPLPPTQWGHHVPARRYDYDPVRGRALLEEAIGAGAFEPAATYRLYAPTTPRPYLAQPERVARFLQVSLEQIGIRTELVLQPLEEHRASLEAGEHDLALHGWVGDTGDPDNYLYVLFHSDNTVAGSTRKNFAYYRDVGVDKLLREAQVATDEVTRTGLYHAVQERIADDAVWVPVAHSEYVVAARAELADVQLSPLGHPLYARIRRRPEAR